VPLLFMVGVLNLFVSHLLDFFSGLCLYLIVNLFNESDFCWHSP
jgi:hypothetical protein